MNLKEIIKNEFDAESAIIGTLIADGSISYERRSSRGAVEITHTARNLDYLKLKKDIFELIPGVICNIKPHNKITPNKTYELFRLSTNNHDLFSSYRDELYIKDGNRRRKLLIRKHLDAMSDFGLFLLYLDDGTIKVRFYDGTNKIREIRVMLCLDSFRMDEQIMMRDWFREKYNISPNINKHGNGLRLVFNTQKTKDFLSIISKYQDLVPSMKYKFLEYYNLS